jgi:hypothetical protein
LGNVMQSDKTDTVLRLRLSSLLFVIAAVILQLVVSSPTRAEGSYRVLVMGEDSDPATVRRTNDIYKRVIAELRRSRGGKSLSRYYSPRPPAPESQEVPYLGTLSLVTSPF